MPICASCTHPRAAHAGSGCRISGCSCGGYADSVPRVRPTSPRQVTLTVPDGYALTIQLVPIDGLAHDPEEALAAIAGIADRRDGDVRS